MNVYLILICSDKTNSFWRANKFPSLTLGAVYIPLSARKKLRFDSCRIKQKKTELFWLNFAHIFAYILRSVCMLWRGMLGLAGLRQDLYRQLSWLRAHVTFLTIAVSNDNCPERVWWYIIGIHSEQIHPACHHSGILEIFNQRGIFPCHQNFRSKEDNEKLDGSAN